MEYDSDILEWSEHQAELLRRAAAGSGLHPPCGGGSTSSGSNRKARRVIPDTIDGDAPLPVPDLCPVTLDELLAEA